MVKIPTGSGKSYVAYLLALYNLKEEKNVAIVTSDSYLVQQL